MCRAQQIVLPIIRKIEQIGGKEEQESALREPCGFVHTRGEICRVRVQRRDAVIRVHAACSKERGVIQFF